MTVVLTFEIFSPQGCLNRCTYCKTKHARGDLISYPPDSLVSRVQTVVREGVREVWLSSEDTGAYGKVKILKRQLP